MTKVCILGGYSLLTSNSVQPKDRKAVRRIDSVFVTDAPSFCSESLTLCELSADRWVLCFRRAAAAQVAAEARGAARVRGAERGHGLPRPHLHGGLHGGRPGWAGAGAGAVRALRHHLPGPAAAHPPLLPVPPQELREVPAHVAAAPPPLRALRPPRTLQHPALQVSAAADQSSGSHSLQP